MPIDLDGKRILVTGAAGAIGGAAVRGFVRRGASVFAVDLDDAGLKSLPEGVITHRADVSDDEQTAEYTARAVETLGEVHGFFNNAGIEGPVAPIPEYPVADFDRVIATNLRGVFLGLHHVLPVLSEGGAVVNTSSSLGQVGAASISAYVASKHGVIGLTKSAALEAAARRVRVNAVCPGPIAGRMIDALERDIFGDSGTTFADLVPFGRHGKPDEVADLVAYLLSDEAGYVTGTAHEVDGAFTTP